tara:strand:- start:245 stop:454 length:210 start_codon:yes stop_codon:yes gene_type:complete
MTKITLDDIEYDSEDFNENQAITYKDLINNNNVTIGIQYQLNSLNVVRDILVKKLKISLVGETLDDNEQ